LLGGWRFFWDRENRGGILEILDGLEARTEGVNIVRDPGNLLECLIDTVVANWRERGRADIAAMDNEGFCFNLDRHGLALLEGRSRRSLRRL
jgi:hypothetical protein